jgi:hypothetical protein
MLDHLRQKAAQTLASARFVVLSSFGPADIQSSRVKCTSKDLTLYVLIPHNSDHLLNLEHRPGVVVMAEAWELQGTARVLPQNKIPIELQLAEHLMDSNLLSASACVVEIHPSRLTIHMPTGQGNLETIDFK